MFKDSLLYLNQSIVYKIPLQQYLDYCLSRKGPYLGQADTQNLTTTPHRAPGFQMPALFSLSALFMPSRYVPRLPSKTCQCAVFISSLLGPGFSQNSQVTQPPFCYILLGWGRAGWWSTTFRSMIPHRPSHSHCPVLPSSPCAPPLPSGTVSQGARVAAHQQDWLRNQHGPSREDWRRQQQSRDPRNGRTAPDTRRVWVEKAERRWESLAE